MISGIASPLIARPPTMPPAGPTGRCSASTAPANSDATRAASLNDMAASGPPSDTARTDFIILISPPQAGAQKCGRTLASIGHGAHTFALANPVHERQRHKHHPGLAQHLALEEFEA